MQFDSILFARPEDAARVAPAEPGCFADLNLDQVLKSMIAGRDEYDLAPFFYTPLHDPESVSYRHDILRDLEQSATFGVVASFAKRMREMRERLAQAGKLHHRLQQQRWFLDAVQEYCQAVSSFAEDLRQADLSSRGLRTFRDYLAGYIGSDRFTALVSATAERYEQLASVNYSIHIKGSRVRVSKYEGEPDYSVTVQETFAKFKQGAVKSYLVKFREWLNMNHVEAQVLELVAQLYPDVFGAMDDYCDRYRDHPDPVITRFDREVQFYIAYLEFIEPLKRAGLTFCYPEVSAQSKNISARDTFDLALAGKLVPQRTAVVGNDFFLRGPERILVITGPNQGGKTTFARMFGQLHYIASLGYPVPGHDVRLFLPDEIFTHFEREEDITTLHGKLEDELTRIHEILGPATGNSVLVMNESFTSTTLNDALFLGTEIMRQLIRLDLLGVYVTFVDELTSLSEATVSMVSSIVPDNPAERTYKIVRKPADGLAYAAAIANKYGLTFDRVIERVAS